MYKMKVSGYRSIRPRGPIRGSFCLGDFHLSDEDRQIGISFGRLERKLGDEKRILEEEVEKIGGWGQTRPDPGSVINLFNLERRIFFSEKGIEDNGLYINEEKEIIARMVERHRAKSTPCETLMDCIQDETGRASSRMLTRGKERQ